MRDKKLFWAWDTVKTIVYAVILALIVRTFAYEPFNIPSGSMKPTLLIGDYLFVSKFSYGYSRHSLPYSLPLISGRLLFTPPKRGDVAVFKLPTNNKTDYIKRIIGLPGDRIQVKKGILHINGEPMKRQITSEFPHQNWRGQVVGRGLIYNETLPEGLIHQIQENLGDGGELDDTDVYRVPGNHYFAMGDNRDNSTDSRVLSEVGFIPRENLVGRAEFLFFSTDQSSPFWQFWKWPSSIRFQRFFQGIN